MDTGGSVLIFLSTFLFLLLLQILITFLQRVWWTPIRIQCLMSSRGIKGPNFRFLHGNAKEILRLKKEILNRPMGLSHHIFPRILPHIHRWINIYGKNFLYWNGPKAQLVVSEPDFVKEILNDKDKAYSKIDFDGFRKKLLGDGLVAANGEKWAKQRKLANHAFRSESLKVMTPAMVASVEEMLERWKQHEGREIEVFEEFKILTSEVISRTAFGSSYLEGKDIFEMLVKMGIITARNDFKIRFPGLSLFLKSDDEIESETLEEQISGSIVKIIQKREKALNDRDNLGTDFLGSLLLAYHDSDISKRITLEVVVDECKTFYLAGHETTANLLTWAVLLLAVNCDWQEKARQEVLTIFGKQHPNSDGIIRLKVISMIINECLRLYPPVVSIARKTKRDVNLGKVVLPGNIEVIMPTLALHHDTRIWGDDAQMFKPERFSEGIAKATNNNPAVFLPFGVGPRSCVGMNFATNQVKIALSMILQRYAFTLSPTYIHAPTQILTVRPQRGAQIILHSL